MESAWLKWAKQLAALSQNGLAYAEAAHDLRLPIADLQIENGKSQIENDDPGCSSTAATPICPLILTDGGSFGFVQDACARRPRTTRDPVLGGLP
jgi:hypothetical protein